MTGPTLTDLLPSWERSLRARNRSPRTIDSYLREAALFAAALHRDPSGVDPATIQPRDVQAHIVAILERSSASSAASTYRRLQQMFRWLVDEGEIAVSPMAGMRPPAVPDKPVAILDDLQLAKLIRVCDGKTFDDRRDSAIVRLFVDTGMRRGEMAGLEVADVDWDLNVVRVTGKGSKPRPCPFGAKTGQALDRYLRARLRHRHAVTPGLWLGIRGRLTDSGIAQMLERRAEAAQIGHIHPHQFRHTSAHAWLARGGQEGDLMRLMGWSSREMVARYGASAADERAREAHRLMAPGDRI